ncbi:MAG: hypothetical protein M3Q07_13995 [Pseudobdellovibrionaceae bacterium]|nr:hypothetical protein [Pseudobdellovibrionaceae bacterium]
MNLTTRTVAISVSLLTLSSSAFAADVVDFSSCTNFGSNRTRCVLENPVILATLPEEMSASYTITYSFPCKGHKTGLAFDAGDEAKALAFTNPERPTHSLTIDGPLNLSLVDQDPSATYRATLIGSCLLTVQSVSVTPSVKGISTWKKDAETQAKIIGLSYGRYQLVADYKSYASWDTTQTQTVLESAKLKIELFKSECDSGDQTACRSAAHFRVVVGALEAKISGAPVPPINDVDGKEILASYREDLEGEVALGKNMVERFKRWELLVSEELQRIIDSIKL